MKHNRKIALTITILVILGATMIFLITSITPNNPSSEGNYCSSESRNAEACIELYQPVCGWFNPEKVQCIKYPCAQTFSNSCFSCMNPDVLYWTDGECPE